MFFKDTYPSDDNLNSYDEFNRYYKKINENEDNLSTKRDEQFFNGNIQVTTNNIGCIQIYNVYRTL